MNSRSWWLMISVGLGILLNPLNSSMVSVAIPNLQKGFHLSFTEVSWILFSFYMASAVAQPVMGKASDLFGRRKIFLAGLGISFLASLLAPFSPAFGWLIGFRVLQSIGTSMMAAVGMAIVRIYITDKQAVALSVLSIFLSGAAAIGPFIGGTLVHLGSWHAIFFINLPIVALSFLLARKTIPFDKTAEAAPNRNSIRTWLSEMDLPGVILFSAGLIALLVGVLSAKSSGPISMSSILYGGLGLLLLAAFVRQELKTASPFIPLQTFVKYPAMTRVNVEFMLINILYYSLFFGLPTYLQTVRHVSEYRTGILMLTLGVCSLAASPFAGRWVQKSGPRPALFASSLLMLLGSVWIITLNPASSAASVCLALAAFGISNGLNSVGMQAALFNSAPKEMIGMASGIFNTSRYLGTILSSLLIGSIMGNQFSFTGFRILGIVLTLIALSLVYLNRRRGQKTHQNLQV